jgi:hypothetical protein
VRGERVVDRHNRVLLDSRGFERITKLLPTEDVYHIEELLSPVTVAAPEVGEVGLPEFKRPGRPDDLRGRAHNLALGLRWLEPVQSAEDLLDVLPVHWLVQRPQQLGGDPLRHVE